MSRPLLLSLLIALGQIATSADTPNILLIFSDDQGVNDVGCYGSEIPTPHIDHLAEEGIRFTQFYSASSICTPSRFGLLTGRNPLRSQDSLLSALMFMAEEHRDTGIQAHETTIAEVLRDKAGYDTALIGKWHLGHGDESLLPLNHGFDTFIGHTGGCIDFFTMTYGIIPDWYNGSQHVSENGYATELITEEAIEYLEGQATREKPFFLYLAYNAPHFGKGYSPSAKAPVNLMQPQAAELKRVDFIEDKIRREFAAMAVSMDDGIGRVLECLDQENLSKDTWVIFLTDHGGDPTYGGSNLPLRGDKATLFEGGIRVPCVMRWPGKITPGSTSDALFWSLDLFPSFSEAAGIEPGDLPLHDGESLLTAIRGEHSPKERQLLWQTGAHSELDRKPWVAYREGTHKYLSSPEEGEFLFNLSNDPNETTDLKNEKPELFRQLRDTALSKAADYRETEH
ncbi:MAG: sulfatase-like hydrolase/transferase [Verrucomicrobiales bacterium]|nr:sulfatase-like hydrolase/transferase [Verrucomicrobiales bacterium]